MDSLLSSICTHHGAFLRREALSLRYDDRAIARLVRSREWHRLRHGAYTLAPIWDMSDAMARHLLVSRAAYRSAGTKVVLSHTSALAVHGTAWWDLPLSEVHLTRRDRRAGRRIAGVAQHRSVVLDEDVHHAAELTFMSPTRTALEITTITDVERSLVVVNDLLHAGKTSLSQLRNAYVEIEMWPGTLHTDLILRLCDPRIESVAESRAFYAFFAHGLPRPVPQWKVLDRAGRLIARLDFAWPSLRVFLEVDGRVKYARPRDVDESEVDVLMREKRREQRVVAATGWECVRITWADLERPEHIVALVRAAFARAARRRPA